MGLKMEIPKKQIMIFLVHAHVFYVIKNSIYTYHRKFILDLNERDENLYC